MHASMRDGLLRVCDHNMLQTACVNFTKVTTQVQLGTKMNSLNYEVKSQCRDETMYS